MPSLPLPDDKEPGAIYVLKDGARLGPFAVDDLLELIDEGTLSYNDACLRAGATETERIRQVLDWDGERDVTLGENIPEAADNEGEETDEDGDDDWDEDDDWEEEEAPNEEETFAEDEESLQHSAPIRRPVGPPRNPNLILYAGHPSVLSYPGPVLFIVLSLAGGIYGKEHSSWWLFAGLVAALFGVSWILLNRAMRLYLITPRRVEIVRGLIAKNSNEVRIDDVRTINVLTPGIRGLFGVGTVEFASAGGSAVEVAFHDVHAAHRIKGLVRRLQDTENESDAGLNR